MAIPESIRILGIPWTVVFTDSVDGDGPTSVVYANKDQSAIELLNTLESIRQKYHLFWGLLVAVQRAIVAPGAEPEVRDIDAFHAALWIGLRDNWGEAAKWFPATGEPLVEPATLHLHGTPFQLERPKQVPGESRNYMGQSRAESRTIFVRQGMGLWQTSQTALHELMHAATQRFTPLGCDERFIEAVSAVLAQVFFDNPEAVRWLFCDEEAQPTRPLCT